MANSTKDFGSSNQGTAFAKLSMLREDVEKNKNLDNFSMASADKSSSLLKRRDDLQKILRGQLTLEEKERNGAFDIMNNLRIKYQVTAQSTQLPSIKLHASITDVNLQTKSNGSKQDSYIFRAPIKHRVY